MTKFPTSARELVTAEYEKLQASRVEMFKVEETALRARWARFKQFYKDCKDLMGDLKIPINRSSIDDLLMQEDPPINFSFTFEMQSWVVPPGIFYQTRISHGVCLSVRLTGSITGWQKTAEDSGVAELYFYRLSVLGEKSGSLNAEISELELIPQAVQQVCAQALMNETEAMEKLNACN